MLIIGERINSSREVIAQAISTKNQAFIQNEAKAQAMAGAHYIDVNAGTFVNEEVDCLKWIIEVVQEVTDLPLCIDSPNPTVIKAVLPSVKKIPLINSITLEPSNLEDILPLVKEYKSKVIGLCQSKESIAKSTESKVNMASQLVEKVTDAGIPKEDLYIDPLVYPLATDHKSAVITLEAIGEIMREFHGVHTICGLTNISHGLPLRKLVNQTFLIAAVVFGLDSAILDPTDRQLYGALKAALMVAGKDEYCIEYIMSFREGKFK